MPETLDLLAPSLTLLYREAVALGGPVCPYHFGYAVRSYQDHQAVESEWFVSSN